MYAAFVLPAPEGAFGPSGSARGRFYARPLAAALQALGHQADLLGMHDDPEQAWQRIAPGAIPVIDGLVLPLFRPLLPQLVARRAVGLIHHPTARASRELDDREPIRAIEREMLPELAQVVATSNHVAERLAEIFGVAWGRLAVLSPGVDDAPRSTGSGTTACAVLSVGALTRRKGHEVLLHALARLVDLDWSLTIAGDAMRDPAHAAQLDALIQDLELGGRARLVRNPTDAELDVMWRGTDVFALATQWEGYATSIAQALRRGLPVATTDASDAAALTAQPGLVVCPVAEHDTLSKSLRRLIFDPAVRTRMADAAWAAGQALPSWAQQAVRFEQILRRAAG